MLSVHQIKKSFGIHPVLENITFNLNAGEKAGLVGANGCGKTTLLRILAGEIQADSGSFSLTPSTLTLGYLPQSLPINEGETLEVYLNRMQGNLPGLAERLQTLSTQLTRSPADAAIQIEYDAVLAQLQSLSESQGAVPEIMAAFELDQLRAELPVSALSGGQKTRLALVGILFSAPQLLLLDEPTNHLDIAMLEWLEDWLNRCHAAVLLVSHDRVFLDRTVSVILELDGQTHRLRSYPGNYSDYLVQKEAEHTQQWQEYSDQQTEIQRLKAAALHYRGIATFKKGGKADSGDKFAKGFFANRGLATVRRAKSIEKRVERLLSDEKIDKPRDTWQMKMEFTGIPPSSRSVLTLDALSIGYGEKAILTNLEASVRFGERVVLTGANGCGKSTLLRTIIGKLPPLQGRVRLGTSVKPGYLSQEQEELPAEQTVLATLQQTASMNDTAARTFLHKFLFSGDEVYLPVKLCSFGMRSRLSLACLVAGGCNFLLLDEPLNHLDLPSRNQFERALDNFDGTVLVVVHDRYFIHRFATRILEISEGKLRSYEPQAG